MGTKTRNYETWMLGHPIRLALWAASLHSSKAAPLPWQLEVTQLNSTNCLIVETLSETSRQTGWRDWQWLCKGLTNQVRFRRGVNFGSRDCDVSRSVTDSRWRIFAGTMTGDSPARNTEKQWKTHIFSSVRRWHDRAQLTRSSDALGWSSGSANLWQIAKDGEKRWKNAVFLVIGNWYWN